MQIQEVYRACIQKSDASLSSLQLLKEIESKMIGLLQMMQKFPQETVMGALKSKEKAHRLDVKQERKLEQRKNQEERIRKALERAKADPKKCVRFYLINASPTVTGRLHATGFRSLRSTGRRLMTRSEPPKIERDDLKNSAQLSKEEEELAFLFG
ncbi:hypothetical protein P879_10528 [Paragonimus westermani]|uniref:Uncharacterized protein n=1 Tax=Paragonimus westermani TaxID=34504 RepID=A0A8T0D7E7_9TREM|nr:hypothetical protein P879_10528 [Paragonimus westermani]